MSDTLTRDPLMMSFSFIDGHTIDPDFRPSDDSSRPLGYLYSAWNGVIAEPILGEFDEESQTWVDAPGVLTAGVTTYSGTNCRVPDRCADDNCA